MGHMTITTPLSGTLCRRWAAGTSYMIELYLCTKFEISTFTHYEDMKGNKNTIIRVVWG